MDDIRVERILRVVEAIPAGRVATYGDVGAVCGEHARLVGRTLATWGSNVPWWRVVNARGEIAEHGEQARIHWELEGQPLREDGVGVSLASCRVDPDFLMRAGRERLVEFVD